MHCLKVSVRCVKAFAPRLMVLMQKVLGVKMVYQETLLSLLSMAFEISSSTCQQILYELFFFQRWDSCLFPLLNEKDD